MSLGGTLAAAARRFPDRPAVVAPAGWSLTYRGLDQRSDEVAAWLTRRGIGAGDVLALVLPSSPDYLVAYLAAAKLGAVTAGINPRLAPAQRTALLEAAASRLILGTAALLDGAVPRAADAEIVSPAEQPELVLDGLRSTGCEPHPPRDDPDR